MHKGVILLLTVSVVAYEWFIHINVRSLFSTFFQLASLRVTIILCGFCKNVNKNVATSHRSRVSIRVANVFDPIGHGALLEVSHKGRERCGSC